MKTSNHILTHKPILFLLIIISSCQLLRAQILTSSPYSRYGFGELNLTTFAPSAGFGGSFIAYQQEDSIAPFFINVANPAGLAGLRLSTFEVGGQGQFTTISNNNASTRKKNVNFSYGTIGFPLKRFGGMAFGIMPYSTVGYKISTTEENPNIGTLNYVFQGDGGINKVFLGTGIKPFKKNISRFYNSALADTLIKYNQTNKYKRIKFGKQLLSELSIGASGNYLFGTINNATDVIYPGSITYYNSKRQRTTQVNDFTINGGIQTHFTIDSVRSKNGKRVLKQKIKIGFGAFVNTPMTINAKQSTIIYNYSLDAFGNETPKDTALSSQDVKGHITLPLEFGFGLSIKKGEKLTLLLDAATTRWSNFKYFNTLNTDFKNTIRLSAGVNYVPNKIIRGFSNYPKRVHYRLGVSYSDGYLDLKNTAIANAYISAGLGLPVGFGRLDDEIGMVNIAVQYGKNGTRTNNLLQEDFVRLVVGFTFNKRWFIKYKYD